MLSREGIATQDVHKTRQIAVILFCLVASITVIYIIADTRPPGNRENEPILQALVGEEADTLDTVVTPVDTTSNAPLMWTQPRGIPGGNAAWGSAVTTPFDTLWRINTGFEFFSAPALCQGIIYLGCNDGRFRAIDAASGSTIWSHGITCGICGEAAVDSERVYFGGQDGYVYALDRDTGALEWSAGLGYHVFADVAILNDTMVLTGNSVGQIVALDVSSGEVIWDQAPGGLVLGPCVVDSQVVFSTEDGVVAVYTSSGDQVWKRDFSGQASAPSASQDAVFAGFSTGMVRKLDLVSGETLWETDLTSSTSRTVLARPVLLDSTVLIGTCDSRLLMLDSETGTVIWEKVFENWLQVPPVVADSIIFVTGDDQRLHLLELDSGNFIDSLDIGGYSGTAPLFIDGTLIFGTASGELFALRGTAPAPPIEEQE